MFKNWIKEWKNARQQKERTDIMSDITETYNITCKNDKLYLMADGITVSTIDNKMTAKDIIGAIKDMRESALDFKNISVK